MTELFSELTQLLSRVKDTLSRGHDTFLKSASERDYVSFVVEVLGCLVPLDPVGGWDECLRG